MRLACVLIPWFVVTGLAGPAGAGPVRLKIETTEQLRDPFVVTVTGHYADFHNGRSSTWQHSLVSAGSAEWLSLGPVNWVLNMGVSLSIYHPKYKAESQRSNRTPLLVRPVFFDPFRPLAWRDVMRAWPTEVERRVDHPLFAVHGHLQGFLDVWLPAMDVDGETSDAELREHLQLLDELLVFAQDAGPASLDTSMRFESTEKQRAFDRSLASQELRTRVEIEELVRRAHAWLSVPRTERVALRFAMKEMRTPRGLGERLMRSDDLAELGAFLDRYAQDRATRRTPDQRVSWTNAETHITYRVSVLDPPHDCAFVSVMTDLTQLVDADVGDMTDRVRALFCQRSPGEWRYGRP